MSAILRGTATTLTKDKCALDSGSEIATDMETLMGTQDGIQYPGSLLKKFLKRKLKSGSISGECETESLFRVLALRKIK